MISVCSSGTPGHHDGDEAEESLMSTPPSDLQLHEQQEEEEEEETEDKQNQNSWRTF